LDLSYLHQISLPRHYFILFKVTLQLFRSRSDDATTPQKIRCLPQQQSATLPNPARMPSTRRADPSPSPLLLELNTAAATSDQTVHEASAPPRKRLKYDSLKMPGAFPVFEKLTESRFEDEAITVAVGPEKSSFVVHKRTICEASTFFEKALTGGSKEAPTNRL
jgi:hypothetical protein